MGLGLVLVGHVNFLLGALVHGTVLRHISVYPQSRNEVYAISNIIAIVAGLLVSVRRHSQCYIQMIKDLIQGKYSLNNIKSLTAEILW